MSVTEQYLANNARYAQTFSGPLPMPPASQVAVVACMDARLNVYAILGLNEGEAHVIRNAGDLDEDVRQSMARIKASPFIPHKDQIRGFVFDVATGQLNEVT
jgi:carbonic anhydrase